jgi:LysW-gamma-L-lysine carboxypeptidase
MIQPSATLLGLVERYSPTGSESEVVGWLVEHMRALGFSSAGADGAGNAVGVIGRIKVRVEQGVLHGRGSVDAKGPLAAFVEAAARSGAIPGWQVVVIGAVDEEGDSAGAQFAAGRYHPRFAVIGEPSGWNRITLGYRGIMRFRFTGRQPIGHTAAGQVSVCEAAVGFWNRLTETASRENEGAERKFNQLTPVLEKMASADDGFIQTAELFGHFRLPQSVPPEQAERLIREAGEGAGEARMEGMPIAAFRVEKNNPVVGALLAAIRAQGGDPSFSLKLGTSDINIVGPVWNCPMAVYGPGDSTLDHTPEERLSLDEYERSVTVLESLLKRLAFTPQQVLPG